MDTEQNGMIENVLKWHVVRIILDKKLPVTTETLDMKLPVWSQSVGTKQ